MSGIVISLDSDDPDFEPPAPEDEDAKRKREEQLKAEAEARRQRRLEKQKQREEEEAQKKVDVDLTGDDDVILAPPPPAAPPPIVKPMHKVYIPPPPAAVAKPVPNPWAAPNPAPRVLPYSIYGNPHGNPYGQPSANMPVKAQPGQAAQVQQQQVAALAAAAYGAYGAYAYGSGKKKRKHKGHHHHLAHLAGAMAGAGMGAVGAGGHHQNEQQQRAQALEEANDMDVGSSHTDAQEKTFCEYEARNLKHEFGWRPHPDPINETSSLSAVPTPETKYKLKIPSEIILKGLLTTVQCESILHACAQHELRLADGSRQGFYLGDGPGVGKGRQIGGIVGENFVRGRKKALWLSVSADLIYDAKRDLRDIGLLEDIACHDLKDYHMNKDLRMEPELKSGVIFCTYALLVRKQGDRRRIDQIIHWCGGRDFDGVIALDECHRAKHMKQEREKGRNGKAKLKTEGTTKAALFVHELHEKLPNARIVYVSATGASEPEHMQCFARLGLWGPGTSFTDSFNFVSEIKKGECGAMELVAMHMKANGQYLSRILSFKGATFDIVKLELDPEMEAMYDSAADFWHQLIAEVDLARLDRRDAIAMGLLGNKQVTKSVLWGAFQRFWMQMVMACKVKKVVEIAKQALREDKCCVIGLQNTGESVAGFVDKDCLDDDVPSTASGILVWFIQKHCEGASFQADMLKQAKELILPGNPLDEIIDALGGTSAVAEMTGRSKRMVRTNGKWNLEPRVKETADTVNIMERRLFQEGKKLVAIISEAASSGISLQADSREKNQRRRVHCTLQLPWSADKAVQQMGRSHRSNQTSAPEFKLLMTPLGGEARFASAVANRLQSLGALTQGDRRAAGYSQDLIGFSIDSQHGLQALDQVLKMLSQKDLNTTEDLPEFRKQVQDVDKFFEEADSSLTLCGVHDGMPKNNRLKVFLNRIIGVRVKLQNQIFALFSDLLQAHIRVAKQNNTYDEGIVDIAATAVHLVKEEVLYKCKRTDAATVLCKIQGDRGISFEHACKMLEEQKDEPNVGFYQHKNFLDNFVLVLKKKTVGIGTNRYIKIRPDTGHCNIDEHISDIKHTFSLVGNQSVEALWKKRYAFSEKNCGHTNRASCMGPNCTFRKRMKPYYIISGLVLPFWQVLRDVWRGKMWNQTDNKKVKVKVVRVITVDGKRIVGLLVPEDQVDTVAKRIREGVREAAVLQNIQDRVPKDVFFELDKNIESKMCINPKGTDTIHFNCDEGWKTKGGKAMTIRVRAFKMPFANAANDEAEGEEDLEECAWKDCELVLNGTRIQDARCNKVKAIVLDSFCITGDNKLDVHSLGERFIIAIERGSARPLEQVQQYIQTLSMEDGLKLLKHILGGDGGDDDEIMCSDTEVSLRCPLGFVRMTTPAKGKDCKHIQCFDLQTFLGFASKYGEQKCPLCSAHIPLAHLRIDALMRSVLEQVSADADKVRVLPDGTFKELDEALALRAGGGKDDHPAPDANEPAAGGAPAQGLPADKAAGGAGGDPQDAGLSPEVRKLLASGCWERDAGIEARFAEIQEKRRREAADEPEEMDVARPKAARRSKIRYSDDSDDIEEADDDLLAGIVEDLDEGEEGGGGRAESTSNMTLRKRKRKRVQCVDSDDEAEADDEEWGESSPGGSRGDQGDAPSSSKAALGGGVVKGSAAVARAVNPDFAGLVGGAGGGAAGSPSDTEPDEGAQLMEEDEDGDGDPWALLRGAIKKRKDAPLFDDSD